MILQGGIEKAVSIFLKGWIREGCFIYYFYLKFGLVKAAMNPNYILYGVLMEVSNLNSILKGGLAKAVINLKVYFKGWYSKSCINIIFIFKGCSGGIKS